MLVGLPEDHADLVIGEVFFVSYSENFHVLVGVASLPSVAVALLNPLPVRIGHPVALVAEGFRLFLELLAGVDDHHAPTMAGRLFVSQQPDVGEDAGVVEKLVGQHDDGVEPVVLQNPAADLALAGTAVAVGEGRAVEDDGDAAATLLRWLHLGQHGLQGKAARRRSHAACRPGSGFSPVCALRPRSRPCRPR